jgi:hypothetical protein
MNEEEERLLTILAEYLGWKRIRGLRGVPPGDPDWEIITPYEDVSYTRDFIAEAEQKLADEMFETSKLTSYRGRITASPPSDSSGETFWEVFEEDSLVFVSKVSHPDERPARLAVWYDVYLRWQKIKEGE